MIEEIFSQLRGVKWSFIRFYRSLLTKRCLFILLFALFQWIVYVCFPDPPPTRVRLNKNFEIEVIKEYGQLPKIACYAGQLNQVFMNILSNAIDALEEGATNGQWEIQSGDSPTPSIRIRT